MHDVDQYVIINELTNKINVMFQQVGPADAWKFKHIVYIVLFVGILATILFHLSVKEKPYRRQEQLINDNSNTTHGDFLRRPLLYQVLFKKYLVNTYNF